VDDPAVASSEAAFGFGSLWVTAPPNDRFPRIDRRDGSITDEIGVGGGAGPVAVGAGPTGS
jgi:hypothetical protein